MAVTLNILAFVQFLVLKWELLCIFVAKESLGDNLHEFYMNFTWIFTLLVSATDHLAYTM